MKGKSNLLQGLFGQPDDLPGELKDWIEREFGQPVRIFAFCDLNEQLRFHQGFLVATDDYLIIADATGQNGHFRFVPRTFPLKDIEQLELIEGLTLHRLNVVGRDDLGLLAAVFFTRRQRRAIGNLMFVVNQRCKRLCEDHADDRELGTVDDPTRAYVDSIVQTIREAKGLTLLQDRSIFRRLLRYLKPHKKSMIIGFTFSVLLTLLGLLPPYITRLWIDDVLAPAETGALTNPTFWVWLIIGVLVFIWGTTQLLEFFRLRIMSMVGEKISTRLRDELYQHLQRLSLSFYNQRSTGNIISRLISDTDRLWDFVTFGIIEFVISVITIIGVAAALFFQDATLAMFVVLPLPVMGYMYYRFSQRIHGMYLRIWRKWSAMTSLLSDVIPGIRVVRAFAQEKFEVRRFHKRNLDVRTAAFDFHRFWTAFYPRVTLLMHLSRFIVWAYGAPRVLQHILSGGQDGMPLGVFIAFNSYMWMFWGPVQNIGNMTRTFNRATSSASRVFEILDTAPAIVSKRHAPKLDPLQGHIVFDNVTFSYDGVRNVLKGVSFEVFPGEMIGLVGRSGSGKSTIINLICRFYDVSDGAIYIDGHDIRDIDLGVYRKQIGIVLQEPYLFRGTIAENIAYGNHGATLQEIVEAARAANAHEFICGLPDAYDSMVGERGIMLSGGERQRISIARAILHKPRLLILDEATSSVDTETEKKIQEALQRLVSGRTTFAIAHRLSTLSHASRLLVMEDGRLVEQGTHAELLEKEDGVYAKLHRIQAELQSMIAV